MRRPLTPRWKSRGAAVVIESKDEIKARIGSSTDDAVILAWHQRDTAIARRNPRPLVNYRHMPHA